jgi:AcrR family transcriptional regulator
MYSCPVAVKGSGDEQQPGPRFPRRAAGARRTRAALVAAAAELFVEQGYAATTVVQIAARAGVARPTVFTSVPGGKPELLKLARDWALAGDDEPVPVPERPWLREAMAQTDPRELLRRQAGNYRMMNDRSAGLELELAAAARADPQLAELHAQARVQRRAGAVAVVRRLVELGAVAGDAVEDAADTVYALSGPQLYGLLVHDRGWSPERYQAWLVDRLVAALLGPAGST